ncbi:MAG TPA: HlyD family type I secretion periplasmic adaptor subunit, partial [Rhizomicrobium sp.]
MSIVNTARKGDILGFRAMFARGRAADAELPEAIPADLSGDAAAFMSPRRIVRTGGSIVALFVFGFLGWASFAPLDSALMAPGTIIVASHRKTIQHLEGGIVRDIFVHDGQTVVPGQKLIALDAAQASASVDLLEDQADAYTAQEARLVAQRDNRNTIDFPPDLKARESDPKVAKILQGEQTTFDTQRATIGKQIEILAQRIRENASMIGGLQAQQRGVESQLAYVRQEIDSVQKLLADGLSTMPRLLELQRQEADLGGQRGQIIQKIAEVNEQSGENQMQMINLKNQQMGDVVKDLQDVQTKRFDTLDRILAARDVFKRLVLTAPVEGKVVGLSVHTHGAVIKPGETVLEIVPTRDQLEVEAHVRPDDAGYVRSGMNAKVSVTAYENRRLPMITGKVKNISADRLTDERTGTPYFVADVTVDRSSLKDYPDAKIV